MLFPEADALVLKAWIVKRLETPSRSDSDVDADVLADYVLALLRHDGEPNDVRQLCETELYDFLKDEATPFVKDVFQAVTFRSYLPGAPPPPPPTLAEKLPLPTQPTQPSLPTQPFPPQQRHQNGSKKRTFQDSSLPGPGLGPGGDMFMANGWDGQAYGGRPMKQPRRGGGARGGRGGRGGAVGATVDAPGPMPYPHPYGAPVLGATVVPGASPASSGLPPPPPGTSPTNFMLPMETIIQMQQMGLPVPPMYGFPSAPGAGGAWNHNGNTTGRRRGGGRRCREFDKKGFCSRKNCKFEHAPPGADDYDPTHPAGPQTTRAALGPDGVSPGAVTFPPRFPLMSAADMFALSLSPQDQQPQKQQQHRHNQNRARRGGRATFSAEGPVYDQSKTAVVVEGIPDENLNETSVRAFFTQFGPVEEVTLQPKKHLAIVKFGAWESANAAYQSPKVIFDNRFVKVFWYRESENGANGGKPGRGDDANGGDPSSLNGKDDETPVIDMDEFLRHQEEAQKLHEEKAQRKLDVERKRQEVEQRQRDLLARQQQERQRLIAKMAAVATRAKKNGGGDGDDIDMGEGATAADSSTETAGSASASASVSASKAATSTQTEIIRAQLAALEEEAKMLGLDPSAIVGGDGSAGGSDADPRTLSSTATSTWPPRGGGYGGGYRGRGRGAFGGYRGRGGYGARGGGGGANGSGGHHSAYAAYSLDNRPRRVAVTGVDFTAPGPDEALRQFLLGIGDFVAIDTTPANTTITFTDRRTAEKFFYGLQHAPKPDDDADTKGSPPKLIPGIEQPVELGWVAGAVPANASSSSSVKNSHSHNNNTASAAAVEAGINGNGGIDSGSKGEGDAFMGEAGEGDEQANRQEMDDREQQEPEREPQRIQQPRQHMDFDVADEDWDIQ